MIKVVFFASFLVLVVGDELTDKLNEKMQGDWTPVKLFPPTKIRRDAICYRTNNTVLDDYCKCGGKLVPQLKRANRLLSNQLPIIIVENEEELQAGYNATCLCKEKDETSEKFGEFVPFPTHMMIRFLSDNYIMAYDKDYRDRKPNAFAVIIAKEVPTKDELTEFLSKVDFMNNEDNKGTNICYLHFRPGSTSIADDSSHIQRILKKPKKP